MEFVAVPNDTALDGFPLVRNHTSEFMLSPLAHPVSPVGVDASNHPRSCRGFSLVEVTLAMGIASFALLVIFSMLPAGLSSMQDSSRQIVEAEIFNRIGAELTSTPIYSDPVNHTNSKDVLAEFIRPRASDSDPRRFPAYFDFEGNELKAGATNAVFTVQCSMAKIDSYGSVWPPVSTNGQGELRWATVRIGYHKDPGTPVENITEKDPQIRKRTFLIANRGT